MVCEDTLLWLFLYINRKHNTPCENWYLQLHVQYLLVVQCREECIKVRIMIIMVRPLPCPSIQSEHDNYIACVYISTYATCKSCASISPASRYPLIQQHCEQKFCIMYYLKTRALAWEQNSVFTCLLLQNEHPTLKLVSKKILQKICPQVLNTLTTL